MPQGQVWNSFIKWPQGKVSTAVTIKTSAMTTWQGDFQGQIKKYSHEK